MSLKKSVLIALFLTSIFHAALIAARGNNEIGTLANNTKDSIVVTNWCEVFKVINHDIFMTIFEYLDVKNYERCRRVSKVWGEHLVRSDALEVRLLQYSPYNKYIIYRKNDAPHKYPKGVELFPDNVLHQKFFDGLVQNNGNQKQLRKMYKKYYLPSIDGYQQYLKKKQKKKEKKKEERRQYYWGCCGIVPIFLSIRSMIGDCVSQTGDCLIETGNKVGDFCCDTPCGRCCEKTVETVKDDCIDPCLDCMEQIGKKVCSICLATPCGRCCDRIFEKVDDVSLEVKNCFNETLEMALKSCIDNCCNPCGKCLVKTVENVCFDVVCNACEYIFLCRSCRNDN